MSLKHPSVAEPSSSCRAMWFEEHRADLSTPKYTNEMLQLEIHYEGTWGAIWLSRIQGFKNTKIPGRKKTLPLSAHHLAKVS